MSKVTHLYYVTRPTKHSLIEDILFRASFDELFLMVKGGLESKDLVGAYISQDEAHQVAMSLLDLRDSLVKESQP